MRVWCLSDVSLSVAYIGPKSRTERPRKTKIGTDVAHVTHDSDNTFKVKRSTCRGGGVLWWPPAHLVIVTSVCMLLTVLDNSCDISETAWWVSRSTVDTAIDKTDVGPEQIPTTTVAVRQSNNTSASLHTHSIVSAQHVHDHSLKHVSVIQTDVTGTICTLSKNCSCT